VGLDFGGWLLGHGSLAIRANDMDFQIDRSSGAGRSRGRLAETGLAVSGSPGRV
jgi:hypothetical protein